MLSVRPSTTTLVQKAQALASIGTEGLCMARDWAARKLAAQAGMIEKLARRRNRDKDPGLSSAVSVIHQMRRQMLDVPIESGDKQQFAELSASIRGFEGIASKAFFQAIADMIPPQYHFEGRSRRPATDPFNAFLNYALAVLYRKTERALVAAGLNPYLGFMHRDGHQHKSLVYDFIELFRTDLTRVVFSIFSKQSLRADTHFLDGQKNGVILTKAGKALLLAKLDKFFAKKTEWEGLNMSNDRIMEKEALRAVQTLLDLMKNAADPNERSKLILEEALEFTDITLN
jgi:CRISPR-associated protein Cas1